MSIAEARKILDDLEREGKEIKLGTGSGDLRMCWWIDREAGRIAEPMDPRRRVYRVWGDGRLEATETFDRRKGRR